MTIREDLPDLLQADLRSLEAARETRAARATEECDCAISVLKKDLQGLTALKIFFCDMIKRSTRELRNWQSADDLQILQQRAVSVKKSKYFPHGSHSEEPCKNGSACGGIFRKDVQENTVIKQMAGTMRGNGGVLARCQCSSYGGAVLLNEPERVPRGWPGVSACRADVDDVT